MRIQLLSLALISVFSFVSCNIISDAPQLSGSEEVVYFSSFESKAELSGWKGGYKVIEDSPNGGGIKSAHISGGCVYPHFYRTLYPTQAEQWGINAWAKNLSNGGSITLENRTTDQSIYLSIQDDEWKQLSSDDLLAVKDGDEVILTLNAGGFVSSSMLVTSVEVTKGY
ncbi:MULTISPECIES: hypothetical protein [Gracilimonas]|uniref:Lipocalin-like domain-containing protein n=1 Tax=Gracilimonas sediminicola TaxID=2952158 RepID=A0A9X2RHB5_9BACT|nr:hypothetical protein [Gracilimonas sediminicola]MCP9292138.1 hypothetical protein [Gracilimonas sediminicola]